MKKAILFALPMLLGAFVFGQNPLQDFQEFSFKNIKFTENKNTFNAGLSVRFDVEGRYPHSELKKNGNSLFPPDYNLFLWLADKQGDTLAIADANSSFFLHLSGMKGNEYGLRAHFPYYAFAKTGKQEFTLMGRAVNKINGTVLPAFSGESYTAEVIKQIPIEKQQVQVGEMRVIPDTEIKSTKGILFRFPASYTYSENELFSTTEKSGIISYRLVLTHPSGQDVYFPQTGGAQTQGQITDKPLKNATADLSIFVPYTLLSLSEGMQQIQYRIDAQTVGGTVKWTRLREGKFGFTMPRLYLTKASVDSISVAAATYDVAAKDIPLVNLFVGRKSKAGKGLPDLYWVLKSNGMEVLRTSVAQNSLHAPRKSGSFQMLEEDVLTLNVYDHDLLSKNDLMGSFAFPKMKGESRFTQSELTSNHVKTGSIEVMRKVRPDCPAINYRVENTKQEGLSGYLVSFNYGEIRNLAVRNMHITGDSGQVIKTVLLRDFQSGAQNQQEYFVPAWKMPKGAQTSLILSDTGFSTPVCSYTAAPENYLTETDDVKLIILKKAVEVKLNGIWGLETVIRPQFEMDKIEAESLKLKLIIEDAHGSFINSYIPLKTTGNNIFPLSFFIPYRSFENHTGEMTKLIVNAQVVHAESDFVVGRIIDSAEIQIPELRDIPELVFTAKGKIKKRLKCFKIITSNSAYGNRITTEITTGPDIAFTLPFHKTKVYPNDELTVIIKAEFDDGKVEESRIPFTLKDLEKTGEISISKSGLLKKVVVKKKNQSDKNL